MKQYRPILLAMLATACAGAAAQIVQPPPLPPGSRMARPEPGLNVEERKRAARAHRHNPGARKRDFHRDDSLPPQAQQGGKAK